MLNKYLMVGLLYATICIPVSQAATTSKEYLFLDGISVKLWFNKRLPIFDAPNGNIVGSFKLIVTNSWCLLDWKIKGEKVRAVNQDTYPADLCWNPIVYAEENDFYHVLTNSIPGGVWIKKENKLASIPDEIARFNPRKIINSILNAPTFAFKYNLGLVVSSKPSSEAEPVIVIGENHIIVGATGNIEGLWAEVEIYEVNGFPTEEYQGETYSKPCAGRGSWEPFKVNYMRGWIKALDDNGLPGAFTWSTRC